MDSKIQDQCNLKDIKLSLDSPSKDLSDNAIRDFFNGSKAFLSNLTSNAKTGVCTDSDSPLFEWFSVLSSLLKVHYRHDGVRSKCSLADLELLLSSLNYILFYLIKMKGVPQKWFMYLGSASLEFLVCYSQMESRKEDFANAIAQKCYCYLCSVGKEMMNEVKESKDKWFGDGYELCFLGCVFSNLDVSKTDKSGLCLARSFLSNFNQMTLYVEKKRSLVETELQQCMAIFRLALIIYCSVPDSMNENECLFFLETFRLVINYSDLRQRLLDSGGNLYKIDLAKDDGFPCYEIVRLMKKIGVDRQADVIHLNEFRTTLFTCQLIDCLKRKKTAAEKVNGREVEVEKCIFEVLRQFQSVTSQDQSRISRVPYLLTECLSLLIPSLPPMNHFQISTLLVYHKLLLLCTEIFARDLMALINGNKLGKTSNVKQHANFLDTSCRFGLQALQDLLAHSDPDKMDLPFFAATLKSVLNRLSMLMQRTKEKALSAVDSSVYKLISRCLGNAFLSLSNIGRHLRRVEKHEATISLLSPLWPVSCMPEVLPFVLHHENLCDAYRLSGNETAALNVISQAVRADSVLVNTHLMKSLIRIVKDEPKIMLINLFSYGEDKGLALFRQFSRAVVTFRSNPTMSKHIDLVLRHILTFNQLAPPDEALTYLLLGECCWYNNCAEEFRSQPEICKEPLSYVQKAITWYAKDSKNYGDFLAQALMMEAEIHHTHTCLIQTEAESVSSNHNLEEESSEENSTMNSVPSLFSNPTVPQTPLEGDAYNQETTDVFQTPATSKSGMPKTIKPKRVNMDDSSSQDSPGNESESVSFERVNLLTKARSALALWKGWFKSDPILQAPSASTPQEKDELSFRVDRSLALLKGLAHLAVVNHQLVFAVDCYSQAYLLASSAGKTNLLLNLKLSLLPLLGKLGLVSAPIPMTDRERAIARSRTDEGADMIVSIVEDVMKTSEPDKDGANQVPLASYFNSTLQFDKCVGLLQTIVKSVKEMRQKGALTPDLTLSFVESKRLTAEISSLPGSDQIYKSCGLEVPYALEAIAEAVKYVTSAAVCFMGNDFKKASGRELSANSWHIIHEYLMTVSLSSRLFREAGNIKYARTYLEEGLKTARSCLLDSWSGIFLSALANLSLHGFDSTTEASSLVQDAFEAVKDVQEISFTKEQSLSDSTSEEEYPDLLSLEEDWGDSSGECGEDCELCKLQTLPSTFNPPLIKASIELLWTQAEVALQTEKDKTKAFQLLHSALKLSNHLHKFAVHKDVNGITNVLGADTSFKKRGIHSYLLLHLETMLKMAQVSFQAFFMTVNEREVDDAPFLSTEQKNEILKIRKLCSTILVKGKILGKMGKARVVMASAQLIQIQLDYLPHWFKERNSFRDDEKDVDEKDSLTEAVRELRMEEEYWDFERHRKLKAGLIFGFSEVTPNRNSSYLSQNATSTGRPLKQSGYVASQQGKESEKLEESTRCSSTSTVSTAPKRRSPQSDAGMKGTAGAKSSKKQNLSGSKSMHSSKVGSRRGGKSAKSKSSAPVLSLGSSYDIYNDIGEDNLSLSEHMSVNEMSTLSQKGNRSEIAAGLKEQTSRSPRNQNKSAKEEESKGDLSPLSNKLAELNLEASPEANINENKNVRSQRNTRNKGQDVEHNMSVNKPKRRTGRGKAVSKVSDSNEEQIPLVEETEVSSSNGFSVEVTDACVKNDKVDECVVEPKVKRKVGRVTKAEEKNSIESANVTVTRQRRRRKKTPEVDSPEKKREIDAGDRFDRIPSWIDKTALSNELFPSPVILNGDVSQNNMKHQELWTDEEPIKTNQLYTETPSFHSPLSRNFSFSQSQDDREGSTLPDTYNVRPVDAPLSPISPNLWSPIEIPRGRPRRVKTDGDGNSTGHKSQANISRGKKVSCVMNVETARGLGEDDKKIVEKENISTPNQEPLTSSKSKQGKRNQRTGSKLSLRKNASAKEESTAEEKQPDQGLRHESPASVIWSSDDESQLSPNSHKKERNNTLPKEGNSTPNSSSLSLGNKHEKTDENSHLTLPKKGHKKGACSRQDGEKEVKRKEKSRPVDLSKTEEEVDFVDEERLNLDKNERLSTKHLTAFPKEPRGKQLEQDIQQSLDALRAFPHSYLYSQLSKWMALRLWNRACHVSDMLCMKDAGSNLQTSIAALLTDSMHVSFYHMLTRNLHHKLRRCGENTNLPSNSNKSKKSGKKVETSCDWMTLDKEDVEKEMTLLNQVLKMDDRNKSVEAAFETKLRNIPEGWTVVQMSLVNFDASEGQGGQILITRMTSDMQPVTVGIPLDRWKCFTRLVHICKEAVKYDVSESNPEEYWACRYKNNKDMLDFVYLLQEQFLSGHKWLLCGRPNYLDQRIKVVLDEAVKRYKERLEVFHIDTRTFRVILEVLIDANEKDIDSLLQSLFPDILAKTVTSILWEVQMVVYELQIARERQEGKRKPVILLLDKIFNQLPWESMPILSLDVVTRVPSLAALESLLALHSQRPDSPFQTGVNRENVVAVIDPDTNLKNSVTVLLPQFQKYKGWTCLTQQAPTVSDLRAFLKKELYIYNGHGWGRQFASGDDLQMFRAKAVAIIMGCHSGKMEFKFRTDGDGAPLYFLLAGCPAVIGNLWLVTDRDIDRLTSYMMSSWMLCRSPVPLSHLLNHSRGACRLVGLNGYAPVIYGLPVMMN